MDGARREITRDDGTTISFVFLEGSGPAVVLLHGLAGSSRELLPTARALAGRRTILIDQRGHGSSTRVPGDVSREAFVADVVAVVEGDLEGESAAPVDLVGQSLGAHTAMLVAAARPDLVHRLVLLEGNQGGGTADEHQELGDFFRSWDVPYPSREAAVEALGGGPLARAWATDLEERPDGLHPRFDADVMQAVIAGTAQPRWAEWESVTAPTLVVYADGGMFTPEQQGSFVQRGRDVTRADLTNASHDAHLDAFEEWIAVLRAFLVDV